MTNGFSAKQCYNGYKNGLHDGSRSNGHNGVDCSSDSGEDEEPLSRRRTKLTGLRTLRRSSKSAADTQSCKAQRSPSPLPPPTLLKGSPPCAPHSKSASVLDRLVEKLPNFDGANHPFRTEVEKEMERDRVKHFESRIAFLTKEYAGELAAFKVTQAAKENGALSQEKASCSSSAVPAKASGSPPEQRLRRGVKRKRSACPEESESEEKDCVRRSKRTRLCAERYQHLLDSFPRHLPKAEPSECVAQRWKWLSVVDQLRYGEKFQIQARRTTPDGTVQFLLHWDEDDDLHSGTS